MKQQTSNSKRQIKRSHREYNGSRCNRRAEERLNRATNGYQGAISASGGNSRPYTQPGAMKRH